MSLKQTEPLKPPPPFGMYGKVVAEVVKSDLSDYEGIKIHATKLLGRHTAHGLLAWMMDATEYLALKYGNGPKLDL